jgi:hypothetical protein
MPLVIGDMAGVTMVEGGTVVVGGMEGTLRQVIRSTHARLASCGIRTCILTVLRAPNLGGRTVTIVQ